MAAKNQRRVDVVVSVPASNALPATDDVRWKESQVRGAAKWRKLELLTVCHLFQCYIKFIFLVP